MSVGRGTYQHHGHLLYNTSLTRTTSEGELACRQAYWRKPAQLHMQPNHFFRVELSHPPVRRVLSQQQGAGVRRPLVDLRRRWLWMIFGLRQTEYVKEHKEFQHDHRVVHNHRLTLCAVMQLQVG